VSYINNGCCCWGSRCKKTKHNLHKFNFNLHQKV
jgi:hypothetical protein